MPGRVPGSVEPVDPEVARQKESFWQDRRFEYRQGRRRLGTVQEQPPWQRKPLEQTARSLSPASVHQLNVVVVTWACSR